MRVQGYSNAGVGTVGGVVAVSAGREYVGGTLGTAFMSSADHVPEISVHE